MKNTGNIAFVLCLLIIAYLTYEHFYSPGRKKIAVVQMQELMYGFKGMKDATQGYTVKMNKWTAQSDSMESKLRGLIDEIKLDSINHDKAKMRPDVQKFYVLQKSYYEYRQKIEDKAKQEDKEMTQGVINQVGEYMKSFAKQEGYDLIISNTEMQNVGYANDATDVTKKMLEFANTKYEGEK